VSCCHKFFQLFEAKPIVRFKNNPKPLVQIIEKALQERLSQRAIARTLSAGRETVRRVLKKVTAKSHKFC
jgi:DNA invertase Pin-like site-specific DNA recombinase